MNPQFSFSQAGGGSVGLFEIPQRFHMYSMDGPLEICSGASENNPTSICFTRGRQRYIASWKSLEGEEKVEFKRISGSSDQQSQTMTATSIAYTIQTIEAELTAGQRRQVTAGLEALKAEAIKQGADQLVGWPYKAEPASTSPAP